MRVRCSAVRPGYRFAHPGYLLLAPRSELMSRRSILPGFDKRLRRNAQPFMQPPYHFERQRAFTIEHLVHAIAAADEGNEIAGLKTALLHMIPDRLNGVGKVEWKALAFPGLHQRHEHVQAIPLGRMCLAPMYSAAGHGASTNVPSTAFSISASLHSIASSLRKIGSGLAYIPLRMRRSTFGERDGLPFCDELLGCHRAMNYQGFAIIGNDALPCYS
jgi:hypothetical protein